MSKTVVVRLREAGVTSQFLYEDDVEIIPGDFVVVESERGTDYGQILSEPGPISESAAKRMKKILRIMTVDDMRKVKDNRTQAQKDKKTCEKKIKEYDLDMKLINVEYSFDRSKIIFYFTAEDRVDFRNLVKDLARELKTRIEMRQVGVRDEAKLFGGIGPCGQSLCCAAFLRNFEPVTIKMAKEQNLPLNPSKISGICGRLMCCLGYEHQCYRELKKSLPREGQTLQTERGKARVLKVYVLKGELLLEYEEGAVERRTLENINAALDKASTQCASCHQEKEAAVKEPVPRPRASADNAVRQTSNTDTGAAERQDRKKRPQPPVWNNEEKKTEIDPEPQLEAQQNSNKQSAAKEPGSKSFFSKKHRKNNE